MNGGDGLAKVGLGGRSSEVIELVGGDGLPNPDDFENVEFELRRRSRNYSKSSTEILKMFTNVCCISEA